MFESLTEDDVSLWLEHAMRMYPAIRHNMGFLADDYRLDTEDDGIQTVILDFLERLDRGSVTINPMQYLAVTIRNEILQQVRRSKRSANTTDVKEVPDNSHAQGETFSRELDSIESYLNGVPKYLLRIAREEHLDFSQKNDRKRMREILGVSRSHLDVALHRLKITIQEIEAGNLKPTETITEESLGYIVDNFDIDTAFPELLSDCEVESGIEAEEFLRSIHMSKSEYAKFLDSGKGASGRFIATQQRFKLFTDEYMSPVSTYSDTDLLKCLESNGAPFTFIRDGSRVVIQCNQFSGEFISSLSSDQWCYVRFLILSESFSMFLSLLNKSIEDKNGELNLILEVVYQTCDVCVSLGNILKNVHGSLFDVLCGILDLPVECKRMECLPKYAMELKRIIDEHGEDIHINSRQQALELAEAVLSD